MPSVELVESTKMSVLDEASARTSNGCEGAADIEATKDNSPSAAVDQQKPGSNNTSTAKDSLSPVQQMCLIIEHKIRNLEKRKNKLDSYKLHEQEGKHLSNDQKMAILKYDECVTSLELARELCKQFSCIATVAIRDAKKQAKKNAFLKVQQETAKIRESLMILDVVSRFNEDVVREDFLNGINGACQLTEADIDLLIMVYEQTKPKRPLKSTDKSFSCAVKNAAEILSGIIDGKTKAFGGSSYGHAKSILNSIEKCGYFEKQTLNEETESTEKLEQHLEKTYEWASDKNEKSIPPVECTPARLVVSNNVENQPHIFAEAPAATAVPTPSFPLQANEMHTNVLSTSQAIIPTLHPQSTPANAFVVAKDCIESGVIVPAASLNLPIVSSVAPALQLAAPSVAATTVQAVENAYFKKHFMQNPLRPLHDVLGDANFFFLQESEIDKPDIPSLQSSYVSVDQPIINLPLQAVANDFQQFPGVPDSHLVMSVKAPIYNTPHSELTPNVVISNSGAVVSSGTLNNHIALVNETQIMNVQPFQGPIANQNSLSGMQLLPTDRQNVSTLHTVTMHLPASPFSQPQNVSPGTNEDATNLKEHQRCHIRGFTSSNMIVSPTLPETVQEIAKHPEIAHASVQTNKSALERENHEKQKGNHTLHRTSEPIPTPVSMVANVYAHIPSPNMYPDNNMDKGVPPLLNVSSADLHQTLETGANADNVSLNINVKNKLDLSTTVERFSLKFDGQSNRKKSCVAKGNKEEQKEWLNVSKKNDQWPSPASSVAQAQLKKDDTVGRNSFNRVRLSGNGQTVDAGKGSVTPTCSSHQNHLNGGAASAKLTSSPGTISNSSPNKSHAMPSSNLHDVSVPPAGYRNNRSSNPQYTQNGLNSGRFNAENGTSSGNHPTFFKNNERFYQKSYGSHRGGTVYKGRSEKLGGNTVSRINNNSAYSANTSSAVGNGASNTPVGSLEYRNAQNVRSRNNARQNGPVGTRIHQRNNSANLAFSSHSTKDSSGRTQTDVNF